MDVAKKKVYRIMYTIAVYNIVLPPHHTTSD